MVLKWHCDGQGMTAIPFSGPCSWQEFVTVEDYDTLKQHDAAATSFIEEIVQALGWTREGPEEIVNLNEIRDEVLHWLGTVKPTQADGGSEHGR